MRAHESPRRAMRCECSVFMWTRRWFKKRKTMTRRRVATISAVCARSWFKKMQRCHGSKKAVDAPRFAAGRVRCGMRVDEDASRAPQSTLPRATPARRRARTTSRDERDGHGRVRSAPMHEQLLDEIDLGERAGARQVSGERRQPRLSELSGRGDLVVHETCNQRADAPGRTSVSTWSRDTTPLIEGRRAELAISTASRNGPRIRSSSGRSP